MEFNDKRVIVTGASQSIGRAMAIAFAEQGANVVISYIKDAEGTKETMRQIEALGRKVACFQADFSQMENVATFARQALDFLGGVDVLVNNAGMLARETFFELTPEKLQLVYQVNAMAPLHLTQLCAQHMVESRTEGSVINIASIAGTMTMPKGIGYASSKAAIIKWTQNAALNLAEHVIRVNCIAPGVVEAGMNQSTATSNPELWEYYMNSIPMGKPGTPTDIANMALFLASEKGAWITGKTFEVDGGHVL